MKRFLRFRLRIISAVTIFALIYFAIILRNASYGEENGIPPVRRITILNDGKAFPAETRTATVRAALDELDFRVTEKTALYPSGNAPIRDGLNIYLFHPNAVVIRADGKILKVATHATTVSGVIQENGIKLAGLDETSPPLHSAIFPDMHIAVRRVREFEDVRRLPIAFPTVFQDDPALPYGRTLTIQEGREGLAEVKSRVRTEDGKIIRKDIIARRVIKSPRARIARRGTRIDIGRIQKGIASWYRHGGGLTAASTVFPKGTYVRVRHENTGSAVIVRITDYGPLPATGRVIDLERSAFARLAPPRSGLIRVSVEEIRNEI